MSDQYFEREPSSASKKQQFSQSFSDFTMTFATNNGVFSKHKMDFGSRLLLKNLLKFESASLLDLGAGYGSLGLTYAKAYPESQVTLVEINHRAASLITENAKRNGLNNVAIGLGDGYAPITGQKFGIIVTNPPIRAGKAVYYPWVEQAPQHLKVGGHFFCVIQTKQGAKSFYDKMNQVFPVTQLLDIEGGYRILMATNAT